MLLCGLSVGAFSRPVDPDSMRVEDYSVSAGDVADSVPGTLTPAQITDIIMAAPSERVEFDSVASSGNVPLPSDSLDSVMAGVVLQDSLAAIPDTVLSSSLHTMVADTARRTRLSRRRIEAPGAASKIVRSKVDLDNGVDFSAKDSMILVGRNQAYMYGDSHVEYGTIKLDASRIEMNLENSTVYAVGTPDSIGELQGTPVFEDNGTSYEAKTMSYNFKTEQGYIT
ncbi:MAG: hypothetical protein K2I35_03195, partial [Duncaniella sp.]|nr:hypothetical protein [Duncaniella sp.]